MRYARSAALRISYPHSVRHASDPSYFELYDEPVKIPRKDTRRTLLAIVRGRLAQQSFERILQQGKALLYKPCHLRNWSTCPGSMLYHFRISLGACSLTSFLSKIR